MSPRLRNSILALVLFISAISAFFVRRATGTDMAPSLVAGDWLIALPGLSVRPGDVVVLTDPLDPERTILRRAIAGGGKTVQYTDDSLRIGTKRLRHNAMGDADGYHVISEVLWAKPPEENTSWLIQKTITPAVTWTGEPVDVPDGHWFLLADNRDEGVDSRWWGTIPETEIQAVVRGWLGQSHTWRERWTWSTGHRAL